MRTGSLGRFEEEVALGILAELVDENLKASWGVSEATSDLGAGEALNEEGAECFVLTMGSVGGLNEEVGAVRWVFGFTGKHTPQMSD